MLLTEIHHINTKHPFFKECDRVAFLSKNLYNYANYLVKEQFKADQRYLNYQAVRKLVLKQVDYVALPRKVSNQTLMLLDQNWKSFFRANKDFKKNPSKYKAPPAEPKFKAKVKGRFVVQYELGAISSKELKQNKVKLSQTEIVLNTKNAATIKMARIVPLIEGFKIEIVYSKPELPIIESADYLGVDLGVKNFATVGSNNSKITPIILTGGELKSINQYYNKTKARLQSKLGEKKSSKRIKRLSKKRNDKINHKLHEKSRLLVNYAQANNISKIVIGHNNDWKQEVNLGNKNNQNFVQLPHSRFIEMVRYKATLVGIEVQDHEESYTSKCSFLDSEPIGKKEHYCGKREKRGLFRSASGRTINADLNGAYNILRKALPDAFCKGIEGVAVHPLPIAGAKK